MIAFARRGVLAAVFAALASGTVVAAVRVAIDVPSGEVAQQGIVGSFAAGAGAPVRVVVLAVWLAAWALALAAALAVRESARRASSLATPASTGSTDWTAWRWGAPRWLALVGAAVVLGVVLRVHLSAHALLDVDEPWAFSTPASIFDDSHDALVHPPLYRALVLGWDSLVGWTPRSPRWLLRLPSVLGGALSLALLAWLVLPRPSIRAAVALLAGAVASAPISVSALARPYGVAGVAVILVVVVVLDAGERRITPLGAALCVIACALAAWADLIAGLAAILVLALRCTLDVSAGRWRDAAALGACALIPALPLLPGAVLAWRTGIDPATSALPGVLPDLLPDPATPLVSRAYDLFAAASDPLPAASALVMLGALVFVAWRRGARAPVALLALVSMVPLALVPVIELRARHVAWLPLVATAVLTVLPPPLLKRTP